MKNATFFPPLLGEPASTSIELVAPLPWESSCHLDSSQLETTKVQQKYGVLPSKNRGKSFTPPKSSINFHRGFSINYKPSILGYPKQTTKPSQPGTKKSVFRLDFVVFAQGAWPTERTEKFLAKHQRTSPEHLASHLKRSRWIKHLATWMAFLESSIINLWPKFCRIWMFRYSCWFLSGMKHMFCEL